MSAKKAAKNQAGKKLPKPPNPVDPEELSVDPLTLFLDPDNPRLAPNEKGKPEKEIVEIMLKRFSIDELAESICSSGFIHLDPFICCREDGRIVVLEGNRRLATIKLLLKPELTPLRHVPQWDAFRKRVTGPVKDSLSKIPILVYPSRIVANVLAYIGYRHVNGVLPWEPQEKAAYIAKLVEDKSIGWTYGDIAQKIGSKASYVEKLYVAHRLIEQAVKGGILGTERMRKSFGVLTRALQSPKICKFLGVTFPRDPRKSAWPATSGESNLADFVAWTFGTDDAGAVLEDSRDLTKWGQILSSNESLRYLRSMDEPRFDRALAKSGGEKEGLVDSLLTAADHLAEAVPLVRRHRSEASVKRGVERCADFIAQILVHFPAVASEQGITLNASPSEQ